MRQDRTFAFGRRAALGGLAALAAPASARAQGTWPERPVTLVCGLVSPENAGATHLHALAAISRLTRDEAKLQMLADAPTTEAAYTLLTTQFEQDAA